MIAVIPLSPTVRATPPDQRIFCTFFSPEMALECDCRAANDPNSYEGWLSFPSQLQLPCHLMMRAKHLMVARCSIQFAFLPWRAGLTVIGLRPPRLDRGRLNLSQSILSFAFVSNWL
jgi:hypothetical protein